ncbi:MAG: phosphomannomutase/phosphoglucomutase [Candidatus Niyogibacteria bacterium]|nr:phosphomannomutase/phosphoglucomutase [Candidatus Niyogibacteria bacterium]
MGNSTSIFKDYDIRGRVPEDLDEAVAERIGSAFARYLAEKGGRGKVIAGCDARLSSEALLRAFERGVLAEGFDIRDIGLVTSPLFYFSVAESDAAGGAMITASHNPAEWNGVKLVGPEGEPIYKENSLPKIEALSRFPMARAASEGAILAADFSDDYIDFLISLSALRRPLRVVADASNGSGGFLLERLFGRLGIEAETLFFKPDGRFPNHSPNPLRPDAQSAAREAVRRTRADFGFIMDADGDRILFLDEQGRMILGTTLYAFLLDHCAVRGESAVSTVFGSRILRDIAKEKGIVLKTVSVGHPHIKAAMRKTGARIGGELSGHYYWREFHGFDSALLTLMHVLNIVSGSEKPFSELLRPYEKYFHSGELSFEADAGAIGRLREKYADGRQSFLDGLMVEYDDPSGVLGTGWWFAARPSKTEPLLRLVVEADTRERLEEKIKEIGAVIHGH